MGGGSPRRTRPLGFYASSWPIAGQAWGISKYSRLTHGVIDLDFPLWNRDEASTSYKLAYCAERSPLPHVCVIEWDICLFFYKTSSKICVNVPEWDRMRLVTYGWFWLYFGTAWLVCMDLLSDTENCGLCMRRECQERFPRHRWLAIPTCITARASRTCRDECRDRQLAFSFTVGDGESVPGIPGACATLCICVKTSERIISCRL